MEIKEFVEWLWERLAQFPGQNPIVIHRAELEEGLEEWFFEQILEERAERLEKGGNKVDAARTVREG